MAGINSSTTEIPFRAADGVSKFFLFEALRTGCEKIGSAFEQLESARDKAEKMLVKESPVEFESLLEEILDSCVKSLQTHASIIEAVAETMNGNVKQSDGSDGKKSIKYKLLVDQIKDAAAGVEQLRSVNANKDGSPPLPTESDFDSEPEVQSSKKPKTGKPEETTFSDKRKTKSEHTSNTSASVTETPSSGSQDEKPMKGKGKKLGKPPKPSKISNASSRASDSISESTPELRTHTNTPKANNDHPPTTPKPNATEQSFIDEDINAEVEARLAAKELKRAKKKQAKKRKRDSVASDIFSPDPKAEPEHRAILPAKKKARIDKVDIDDAKGKRQNVDDDAIGGKAKAKKQKTGAEKEETTVEANKAKRRRSSGVSVTETVAAPETNNRKSKKRRMGL
ncbi:hypothetical protein KCU78_g7076, partial [Aureobasidium melanogenum]